MFYVLTLDAAKQSLASRKLFTTGYAQFHNLAYTISSENFSCYTMLGMARSDGSSGVCGCLIAILVFNLAFGGWLFDYSLYSITGKDIPWYGDMVCGLFLGEIALPAAIICWVMRMCGVDVPFVG